MGLGTPGGRSSPSAANETPVAVSSGNSQNDEKATAMTRFGRRQLARRGIGEEVGGDSIQRIRTVTEDPLLPNSLPAAH